MIINKQSFASEWVGIQCLMIFNKLKTTKHNNESSEIISHIKTKLPLLFIYCIFKYTFIQSQLMNGSFPCFVFVASVTFCVRHFLMIYLSTTHKWNSRYCTHAIVSIFILYRFDPVNLFAVSQRNKFIGNLNPNLFTFFIGPKYAKR